VDSERGFGRGFERGFGRGLAGLGGQAKQLTNSIHAREPKTFVRPRLRSPDVTLAWASVPE